MFSYIILQDYFRIKACRHNFVKKNVIFYQIVIISS